MPIMVIRMCPVHLLFNLLDAKIMKLTCAAIQSCLDISITEDTSEGHFSFLFWEGREDIVSVSITSPIQWSYFCIVDNLLQSKPI